MKFPLIHPYLPKLMIAAGLLFGCGISAVAQSISGIVKTSTGEIVPGATINSASPDKYAISDENGNFKIDDAVKGEIFTVMCFGYTDAKFTVTEAAFYEITMHQDNLSLEETVVVGYGTQKKATVTGAVAAVGGDELIKTKNTNVQNMLTGRIAGLRVVQNTAEPGTFDVDFDIRGFGTPLIIIDGVPRTNMARLDPNEIESISVLKDASAAVYGVQAANGVVLITTKKTGSEDGRINVDYNGNMTWQMTSGLPSTVGVVDYMRMMNEKSLTDVNGAGIVTFPEEEIQKYVTGEKKETDWYRGMIREFVPQTQHSISVSGGNDRISFFTSLGYQYQEGFFEKGTLNYNRFNLRTKLSAKITRNLTLDLNLSGISDEKFSPRAASNILIRSLWKQFPTDPIYANNQEPYYYMITVDDGINPVALLDTDYAGYQKDKKKFFQSSLSLTWDIPFVKGLSLKGFYSYDYDMSDGTTYNKEYNLYEYDELAESYNAILRDSPSSIRRSFSDGSKNMFQVSVSYDRSFAGRHNVKGLLLYEGTWRKGDNFYALRELSLDVPYLFAGNSENQEGSMNLDGLYEDARVGLVGRFNYDYKGKYLAEFLFRYDGSSIFPENSRFGFFPSASVGYRISEENFWKNSGLRFINNLKIRASYGILGDDNALAYQFLTGYTYPSQSIYFDGTLVNGVSDRGIANTAITWYTSHIANIGIDFEAWKGMLGITFDAFQRKRTGLLGTRNATLPGTVGATLPQENLNSDKNIGFELEVSHRNTTAFGLYYSIKANMSITRMMNIHTEQTLQRSSYHAWKNSTNNRFKNIWWGIEAGGQFQSFDEIAEFPIKTSRSDLPGNYWYKDWNGDGFIDDKDEHPIGYNSTPLLNYALSFDLEYRGFDLNILLQGAAMSNVAYTERLAIALGNQFPPLSYFKDRWRPAEVGADPFKYDTEWIPGKYPSMGGAKVEENSEFNVHNGAYLRLKNIELGYTFPNKWMKKVRIKDLRLFINGYNLLTFSHIKFVDPEHPSKNNGYMYPLNKTISIGVNLKF